MGPHTFPALPAEEEAAGNGAGSGSGSDPINIYSSSMPNTFTALLAFKTFLSKRTFFTGRC
jgi:hypothetical protein